MVLWKQRDRKEQKGAHCAIRIAVVDDDWYISSRIERILLSYDHISTYDLDIEVFQNGLDYFKYLKNEHDFDLIFLDIEMSGPNGVEIGRHIRNVMKNNITQIVYITAFDGYEQALFKVRPMDFLKKPFTDIDVINTVEIYIELYDSAGKLFEFTSQRKKRKVPFNQILYFKSNDKVVDVITIAENAYFYGKLNSIVEQLPCQFQVIHKSYIINKMYVKKYNYTNVVMTNDDVLTISQNYRSDMRQLNLSKNNSGKEFFCDQNGVVSISFGKSISNIYPIPIYREFLF